MTDVDCTELEWDQTVDVLCVGAGPGALAYGIYCDASGLDVLIVESSDLDAPTLDYHRAMTEDLDVGPADELLAVVQAELIVQAPISDKTRLEPFVGEQLRQWSARCLASPFGVMFTEVPALAPMRAADGGVITAGLIGDYDCAGDPPGPALCRHLIDRAEGLLASGDDRMAGLIMADGRIAGATLQTVDGPWRVRAARGLAFSVGPVPGRWPAQPELSGLSGQLALVGRRAGRFARLELLQS